MNDQNLGFPLFAERLAKKPRLLIVDDDSVNLLMIGAIFEEDHEVILADSGGLALEICRKDAPDLLLLDILMPDLDGLEVCRELKADPATQGIPIIFITAQGTPHEETAALSMGAVDFITKPVNPSVVRARVKTHLTLKAQSDLLRSLAFLDGLTGVANRRRFDECLEDEWRRSRRNGAPLTLLMCDIDKFKNYNDCYGHQAGDACLLAVSHALDRALRRSCDLVARYGGEEFVCVLPETDRSGGLLLAETMLDAVRALAIAHEDSESGIVTISLGLASTVASDEGGAEQLIAMADARLYEAKANGRNRVEG